MTESNGTKLVKVGMQGIKVEGSAWSIAGLMILESNTFGGENQKEQAKIFSDHWSKDIDPAVIPKVTYNRAGEKFELLNDDGTYKLSSWDATKAGMKAMNEITKQTRTYAEMVPDGASEPRGIEKAIKEFFPKGKVISGRKMREKIGKIDKDPLAVIERATKLILDSVHKVDISEVTRMDACFEQLVEVFSQYKIKATLKKAA